MKRLSYLQILSRHPSHSIFRKAIRTYGNNMCFRLGSTTRMVRNNIIEINSVEAIQNSSSKKLMKARFAEANVRTAEVITYVSPTSLRCGDDSYTPEELFTRFPAGVVTKSHFGSRGMGNTLHRDSQSLKSFIAGHTMSSYIIEAYRPYAREYRLHVTEAGCFYTCRKMLKKDTPEEAKWFRNDSNCVWIVEDNPLFDKPVNWNDCIAESVKALKAVGLDVGAVDLRVESAVSELEGKRNYPNFIVIEINSAPAMGEITAVKYFEEIPKIIARKLDNKG